MVFHELATSATKHGALSVPGGRVHLSWERDEVAGLLRLRWLERGGPEVASARSHRGFVSRVVERTVQGQLGVTLRQSWQARGLVLEAELPLLHVT
jgi:two-component sensor histidine kinase